MPSIRPVSIRIAATGVSDGYVQLSRERGPPWPSRDQSDLEFIARSRLQKRMLPGSRCWAGGWCL